MLIFSKWRPDGGYSYYETSVVAPFGDDLPDPVMPKPTKLGAVSVEVGQAVPAGARYRGEGDVPVGVMAAMDRSRLGELWPAELGPVAWFIAGALSMAALGWLLGRRAR
jgi:hypothetical protein